MACRGVFSAATGSVYCPKALCEGLGQAPKNRRRNGVNSKIGNDVVPREGGGLDRRRYEAGLADGVSRVGQVTIGGDGSCPTVRQRRLVLGPTSPLGAGTSMLASRASSWSSHHDK